MNRNTTCSECSGKMQRGFIVETEISGNPLDATFWLEGEPEKGWLGLKTKGKQAFHITAFRCESCGFLKLYAETNVPPNK
ncbi:MAG TPA: PF20097 family protein [Anaerolineales bacterium]|nr:PF20097 family protein [Anaerolineales bacterium]